MASRSLASLVAAPPCSSNVRSCCSRAYRNRGPSIFFCFPRLHVWCGFLVMRRRLVMRMQIFTRSSLWSVPKLKHRLEMTPASSILVLLSASTKSMKFLVAPLGDTHVHCRLDCFLKKVWANIRSLLSAKSTRTSPFAFLSPIPCGPMLDSSPVCMPILALKSPRTM